MGEKTANGRPKICFPPGSAGSVPPSAPNISISYTENVPLQIDQQPSRSTSFDKAGALTVIDNKAFTHWTAK
jgi:hypothetical protein